MKPFDYQIYMILFTALGFSLERNYIQKYGIRAVSD